MSCLQVIFEKRDQLTSLITEIEKNKQLPLYSSVDIRHAKFKVAVVDTNLFPSGFNNLCQKGLSKAEHYLKEAILNLSPKTQRILLVIENHTRNQWYLENVYTIYTLLTKAGFDVIISTVIQDTLEENCYSQSLKTALNNELVVHDLKKIVDDITMTYRTFDFVLLNNDLISGVPSEFSKLNIPIYPSAKLGWHERSKSHHFLLANTLIETMCQKIHVDPWCFSCLFRSIENVDIYSDKDLVKLADLAADLGRDIQEKYTQYGINEKPFIFLKADSGSYGMGIHVIENPQDIITMNRKTRNKLAKGKNAKPITNYILQEGVPTQNLVNNVPSETCIYQVNNHYVGSFFRTNSQKTIRSNLNSKGMEFLPICDTLTSTNDCCIEKEFNKPSLHLDTEFVQSLDKNLSIYTILARISGLAAEQEMTLVENTCMAY